MIGPTRNRLSSPSRHDTVSKTSLALTRGGLASDQQHSVDFSETARGQTDAGQVRLEPACSTANKLTDPQTDKASGRTPEAAMCVQKPDDLHFAFHTDYRS